MPLKLICSNIMHKNTLVNYQADSALSNEGGLMFLQKCDSWIKTDVKLNSTFIVICNLQKDCAVLWIIFAWDQGRGCGTRRQEGTWGSVVLVCLWGQVGWHGPLLSSLLLAFKSAQCHHLKVSHKSLQVACGKTFLLYLQLFFFQHCFYQIPYSQQLLWVEWCPPKRYWSPNP